MDDSTSCLAQAVDGPTQILLSTLKLIGLVSPALVLMDPPLDFPQTGLAGDKRVPT